MQSTPANLSIYSQVPLLPLLDSLHTNSVQSFSDSESEIDQDRCYLMEIEQLKRENSFLKKKIAELSKRHPALTAFLPKKKPLPAHVRPAESILALPQQNYIVAFFEEVTRLLESFSELFRVGVESELREGVQRQQESFSRLAGVGEEENLSRRLGRVLLEPEERRFGELLGIFESYYVETQDRSRCLKAKVDQLTTEAIDLGKRMAESIRNKQKMKSSRIFSAIHQSESCEDFMMKSSNIKSTCTDSQLDLSACKMLLEKDKFFNIF